MNANLPVIDQNSAIATRNLTAYTAKKLREMGGKELRALAKRNAIQEGSTVQETLANIMEARISESRKLGHISRQIVQAANRASVGYANLPVEIWTAHNAETADSEVEPDPKNDE